MGTLTIEVPEEVADTFRSLSLDEQKSIMEWLQMHVFPTGGDQLIVALEMVESGFPLHVIEKVSRLEREFLKTLIKETQAT